MVGHIAHRRRRLRIALKANKQSINNQQSTTMFFMVKLSFYLATDAEKFNNRMRDDAILHTMRFVKLCAEERLSEKNIHHGTLRAVYELGRVSAAFF